MSLRLFFWSGSATASTPAVCELCRPRPNSQLRHAYTPACPIQVGTGFLPPETDAQKGATGDVSKQRPRAWRPRRARNGRKSGLASELSVAGFARPVYIIGTGESVERPMVSHMEDFTTSRAFRVYGREALKSAGYACRRRPSDDLRCFCAFAALRHGIWGSASHAKPPRSSVGATLRPAAGSR
jgi:hypothetical protein